MKNFLTSLFTLTVCWNVCFRLLLLSHVFTLLTMCIVTSRTLLVDDFWLFLSQVLCHRNTSRVEQSSTWTRGQPEAGQQPAYVMRCCELRYSSTADWLNELRLTLVGYCYNTRLACCQTVYSASLAFYRISWTSRPSATRHVLGECCAVSSHQVKYLETQWSSHRVAWYYLGEDGEIVGESPDINQYLLRVELWAAVTMNYKHSILFLKIKTGIRWRHPMNHRICLPSG